MQSDSDTRLASADMVFVAGGSFRMGSDRHYPEEAPQHQASVDSFWIDRDLVTNARFRTFVAATGYTTFAERVPDPRDYPGVAEEMLRPASLVFTPPAQPVPLHDISRWWSLIPGANWRQPYGPGSGIDGLDDHPVVHVAFEDAVAYCTWAGKDLPTEADWEFAARGGLDGADYAWGDLLAPDGRNMANIWHGEFPHRNSAEDGFERTSPVGAFPANGYGLHDMIGNVWEWTKDRYASHHAASTAKSCCVPRNPQNPATEQDGLARMVLKGGSHLCAPNYCRRYRPAARQAHAVDTTTTHIGFRCVRRG